MSSAGSSTTTTPTATLDAAASAASVASATSSTAGGGGGAASVDGTSSSTASTRPLNAPCLNPAYELPPLPEAGTVSAIPDDFVRRMPKSDLHVHLDGSLRLSTLIELAKEAGVELPAYDEEGLRKTVFKDSHNSLEEYLTCFRYTVAVMQTPAARDRISYEFAVDNFSEGVRYFEVRFAPQLFADVCEGQTIEDVLRDVNNGLQRAKEEFNASEAVRSGHEPSYEYAIIVCALRDFNEQFSPWYRHFCALHRAEPKRRQQSLASMVLVTAAVGVRDSEGIPVVALDIAGPENGYPASWHKEAYTYAHKNFMRATVHAGEAYGPESIEQALTDLHADRIGHGLHMFASDLVLKRPAEEAQSYVESLAGYIADRRLHLEVCLKSNLDTIPGLKLADHSIRRMLACRMSVSLCTDNRLVSNTTSTKEHMLARDTFGLSFRAMRDIVVGGFKRAFFPRPYIEKRRYVRQVIDYFDRLAQELGVSDTLDRSMATPVTLCRAPSSSPPRLLLRDPPVEADEASAVTSAAHE